MFLRFVLIIFVGTLARIGSTIVFFWLYYVYEYDFSFYLGTTK